MKQKSLLNKAEFLPCPGPHNEHSSTHNILSSCSCPLLLFSYKKVTHLQFEFCLDFLLVGWKNLKSEQDNTKVLLLNSLIIYQVQTKEIIFDI